MLNISSHIICIRRENDKSIKMKLSTHIFSVVAKMDIMEIVSVENLLFKWLRA